MWLSPGTSECNERMLVKGSAAIDQGRWLSQVRREQEGEEQKVGRPCSNHEQGCLGEPVSQCPVCADRPRFTLTRTATQACACMVEGGACEMPAHASGKRQPRPAIDVPSSHLPFHHAQPVPAAPATVDQQELQDPEARRRCGGQRVVKPSVTEKERITARIG